MRQKLKSKDSTLLRILVNIGLIEPSCHIIKVDITENKKTCSAVSNLTYSILFFAYIKEHGIACGATNVEPRNAELAVITFVRI